MFWVLVVGVGLVSVGLGFTARVVLVVAGCWWISVI